MRKKRQFPPSAYPVFIPTVRIASATDQALRATASLQGAKVSDVVRSALDYYLSHPATKPLPQTKKENE